MSILTSFNGFLAGRRPAAPVAVAVAAPLAVAPARPAPLAVAPARPAPASPWGRDALAIARASQSDIPLESDRNVTGSGQLDAAGPVGGGLPGDKIDAFVANAMRFQGLPYLWGGGHGGTFSQPGRVDCSGLVQQAARMAGINLDGTADMQQQKGRPVPVAQARKGDLVFMGNPAHHVGICIGNGQVIEAPHTGDVVKVVSLNGYGWTSACRVFDAPVAAPAPAPAPKPAPAPVAAPAPTPAPPVAAPPVEAPPAPPVAPTPVAAPQPVDGMTIATVSGAIEASAAQPQALLAPDGAPSAADGAATPEISLIAAALLGPGSVFAAALPGASDASASLDGTHASEALAANDATESASGAEAAQTGDNQTNA